jgi:hypothetical protein
MDDSDSSSSSNSEDDHQLQSDDDDDDDDDDDQSLTEEEIAAAAAAAEQRHLKMNTVLERKRGLPFRTRKKVDQLVEAFLANLGFDIYDMLCDDGVDEEYRGLDSERDTEEEVESAIILFPDVLSRREQISDVFYPINHLVRLRREDRTWRINLKALSFIPLVVRLSIELGLFEEQERGGLLSELGGYNPLESLVLNDQTKHYNREHHEPIDDKCLQVLIQLRKMDLFQKRGHSKVRPSKHDYVGRWLLFSRKAISVPNRMGSNRINSN